MDRSHEVADLDPSGDVINLPKRFIGARALILSQVVDIGTEVVGKEEVMVQEEKIRIDVEESKSNITAI
jgi:hypothetical protein